jgi:hypothetical protein
LRERGPDDIAGQVFHDLFFLGIDSWATEDLKTGMLPGSFQIKMIGSKFTLREKQGQDFPSEKNLQ